MIGYPNGLSDQHNNLPIVRRGITATPPSLDFNGQRQFVVDCGCYPGSSGSPIFTYQTVTTMDGGAAFSVGPPRISLIGVLFAGPRLTVAGDIVPREIPTSLSIEVRSMTMMHLGYCIKSTELAWLHAIGLSP